MGTSHAHSPLFLLFHSSPTGSLGSSQLYSSEKPRDSLNATWKVSGGVRTVPMSPAPQPKPCCYVHGLPLGSSPSGYPVGEEEERGEHTRMHTHTDTHTRVHAHTPRTHSHQDQHSLIFSLSKVVTFAPSFLPSPALLSSQLSPLAILPLLSL